SLLLALVILLATAPPARADITALLGANTTPSNRLTRGVAFGAGLLIVGFEFEYSSTDEDTTKGAPSLRIGSANGLIQTPFPIFGFQPYVTAGAGVYQERFGLREDT